MATVAVVVLVALGNQLGVVVPVVAGLFVLFSAGAAGPRWAGAAGACGVSARSSWSVTFVRTLRRDGSAGTHRCLVSRYRPAARSGR